MFDNYKKQARGKRIYQAIQDEKRGYSINGKIFFTAYLIEFAIILAAGYAGWQFANHYATGDSWTMAIIATFAIAAAELGRLLMVHGFRTQRSKWMKAAMLIGVGMMCIVTTKSMSQVMEQMFHPRLRFVQEASANLKVAQDERDSVILKKESLAAEVKPMTESVERLDAQITELNKTVQGVGAAPAPKKVPVQVRRFNKRGKPYYVTGYKLVDVTWEGRAIMDQISDARQKRDVAAAKRDDKAKGIADLDAEIAQKQAVVTAKANDKQTAVTNSQLHSFSAMVFGKDPVEVTDGEVHWFLRFFVLIPALMIAISSSLLMMAAYTILPKSKETIAPEALKLDIATEGTIVHLLDGMVRQRNIQKVA